MTRELALNWWTLFFFALIYHFISAVQRALCLTENTMTLLHIHRIPLQVGNDDLDGEEGEGDDDYLGSY